MRMVYLCGQTGNANRGCEAIIRSSVKLLGERRGDITLMTSAKEDDYPMASDLGINVLSYDNYPTKFHRYFFGGIRKVWKKSLIGMGTVQKPLFSRLKNTDMCLNIGGDTYCYTRPLMSFALNKYTSKRKLPTILWCCSIEPSNMKGEWLRDLHRYRYIFAREQITYNALLEAGLPQERVVKCCDPAFFLDVKETELPNNFVEGNTVGINVSGIILRKDNPQAYENVIALIKRILAETDMSVCLIPHVYRVKEKIGDYPILKRIYEEIGSNRLSLIDKEYTCEQLKYIISKCRFLVAARTHASIAGYSTCVPTLVIGYSIKSKGIATDLFGTDNGYVLRYDELTEKNELSDAFFQIISKEEELKARLREFLPVYKKSLVDGIEKYINLPKESKKPFEICERELCTGCSACAQSCPKNCIAIKRDKEGFSYPEIDFDKCSNCGLCRKICPVANRLQDSGVTPKAYYVENKDEEIRKKSSSGGVFHALAKRTMEKGGVVFGAGFSDSFGVGHTYCASEQGLSPLLKSKYVQSEIGNSYKQAKEFLEAGKEVLFCGTPCQIGGLYAYLGKKYENLCTVDFVCHGVASPDVWEGYLASKEREFGAKAKSVSFRDKKDGWKHFAMKILFENGKEYHQSVSEDIYLRGFVADLYLRPSCFRCSFKQKSRQSDITLADFWGIDKILPNVDLTGGTSLVLVQSPKGEVFFAELENSLRIGEVSFNEGIKYNKSYLKSVESTKLRKKFFKGFRKDKTIRKIKKYYGKGFMAKLRRKIS